MTDNESWAKYAVWAVVIAVIFTVIIVATAITLGL